MYASGPLRQSSELEFELAFLGNAFKRFAGILDAILVIFTIGRQESDHLITAARTRPADRARRVEYRLTDTIFMRSQYRRTRHNLLDSHRLSDGYGRNDVERHIDLARHVCFLGRLT